MSKRISDLDDTIPLRAVSPATGHEPVSAGTEIPRSDLKVLLVHGIGDQQAGNHLLDCVEAVVDLLADRLPAGQTQVEAAFLGQATEARPSYAVVQTGEGGTWLIAESHWAKVFPEPTYRDITYWGLKVIPIAAVGHGVGRVHTARSQFNRARSHSDGQASSAAWAVTSLLFAAIQLIILLLVAPLLILAVVLLLAIGLLPIAGLRSAVLRAQHTLAGSVGDSYVFMNRSVRRSAIVTKVRTDLQWLRSTPGNAPLVVVAHSQGAAVAHTVLRQDRQGVDTLITYGSGLGKLLLLQQAAVRSAGVRWYALLAAVAGLVVAASLPRTISAFLTNVLADPQWWGYLIGAGVAYSITMGMLLGAVDSLGPSPGHQRIQKAAEYVAAATMTFGGLVGVLLIYSRGYEAPAEAALLVPAIAFLIIGLGKVDGSLSIEPESISLHLVRQWLDIKGDADPVPTDLFPTDAPKNYVVEHTALEGSTLKDHVSYWRRPDAFVWRVVAVFVSLSRPLSEFPGKLKADGEQAARNRARRIRARMQVRWLLTTSILVLMLSRLEWTNTTGVPYTLQVLQQTLGVDQPPLAMWWRTYLALGLLFLVAAVLSWLVYQLVLVPWRMWDWVETRAFLEGFPRGFRPVPGSQYLPWVPALAGVFWFLAVFTAEMVVGVARFDPSDVLFALDHSLNLPILLVGLGIVAWLLWLVFVLVSGDNSWTERLDRIAEFLIRSVRWMFVGAALSLTVLLPVVLRRLAGSEEADQIEIAIENDAGAVLVILVGIGGGVTIGRYVRRTQRRRAGPDGVRSSGNRPPTLRPGRN